MDQLYEMFALFLSLWILFVERNSVTCLEPSHQPLSSAVAEGKKQYEMMLKNTELPDFGVCWMNAAVVAQQSCSQLTEHTQSQLALKITDCFLGMSGEKTYECGAIVDVAARKECIAAMPDRAFHVYAESFTHAQNICFFLKSSIWQIKTEHTIDKLSSVSRDVYERLEDVQKGHDDLMENQQQSLSMQKELLDNGLMLNTVLQESRVSVSIIMEDLSRSTKEQAGAISQLAGRLAALQTWALGEVSWLESVIHYTASMFIWYMLTSVPRTQKARMWIFILIVIGLGLEQMIHKIILPQSVENRQRTLSSIKADLYYWTWKLRYVVIAACIGFYLFCMITFQDYVTLHHQMLCDIHEYVQRNQELQGDVKQPPSNNGVDLIPAKSLADDSAHDKYMLHVTDIPGPVVHHSVTSITPKQAPRKSRKITPKDTSDLVLNYTIAEFRSSYNLRSRTPLSPV